MPKLRDNEPDAQAKGANNASPANASDISPEMVEGFMDPAMIAALAPMFAAINTPVMDKLDAIAKELDGAREEIRILIDLLAGAMEEMDKENQP